MAYYTGIGSRETPEAMLAVLEALAQALGRAGYVLRSGGAHGADTAFENGAKAVGAPMDIHLPWRGFNGNTSRLYGVSSQALALAQTVHPRWDSLEPGPRRMHARNCFQILGRDLNVPSDFVVCWTPDGCESEATRTRTTGGTATGIVLALRRGIPVFNLKNHDSARRLNALLAEQHVPHRVLVDGPPQGALF